MHWLPKPLKKKAAASSITVVEIKSQIISSESWHREVLNSTDILHYLETGKSHNVPRLENLQRTTSQYLEANNVNRSDWEAKIEALIQNHVQSYNESKDLAILACLHVLSPRSSILHLLTLINLNVERYLRCLSLVPQTNQPTVISQREAEVIHTLLEVYSGKDTGFPALIKLLGSVALAPSSALLPKPLVRSSLVTLKKHLQLPKILGSYFQERQLMSAYTQISLLRNAPELTANQEVASLLDEFLPQWRPLLAWSPNVNRIRQWEYGQKNHREKLLNIFDLEGPSPKQVRLGLLEPDCYQNVGIQPQTLENLESFLDLLYRSHVLGPFALELFIHFCIDNVANESSMSIVKQSIEMNDDSICKCQLTLLQVLESKSGLARRVRDCIKFLGENQTNGAYLSNELLSKHIINLMKEVRLQFMEQLMTTSGEYLGMMIYQFGHAITNASWIHHHLSTSFLSSLSVIPSRQVLEILFQLLEEMEIVSISESRFKRYLASTLGSASKYETGQLSPELLKMEVEFWRKRPDTYRKGIAQALSNLKTVSYTLYNNILVQMFNERDLYIQELRHAIDERDDQSCLNLAAYLSQRHELNQMKHECWLLLLAAMVSDRLPLLAATKHQFSSESWIALMDKISGLLGLVKHHLPRSGPGVTPSTISWWQNVSSHRDQVQFLIDLKTQKSQADLGSLYFLESEDDMNYLASILSAVKPGDSTDPTSLKLFSHLSINWLNASQIHSCNENLQLSTKTGRAVIDRTLHRHSLNRYWSPEEMSICLQNWFKDYSLSKQDKKNLEEVRMLLGIPLHHSASRDIRESTRQTLNIQYEELMKRAQILQSLTLQYRRNNPWVIANMLVSLGIEDAIMGRTETLEIPDALIDSAELVGQNEFELSFPLTEIQDLKKQAMGIPAGSKLLIVRVSLSDVPKFCIHFSPPEHTFHHRYWRAVGRILPTAMNCSKPTLFGCYLARNLHGTIQPDNGSLEKIHSHVQRLLKDPPDKCINCLALIGTKLWKPASCSKFCNSQLRQFPLEVRLHNLFVDPLVLDLLLNSVYCAVGDPKIDLLQGCPVQTTTLKAVIDSFQPMASYAAAPNLQAALRGTDGFGQARESLLSWICLQFRGFITTAPSGFRVPSMPGTTQFIVLNSSHEREKTFNAAALMRVGGPVFHGTTPARLLAILSSGLKNMSNTPGMLHGAAGGAGIYLADEQSVSTSYATSIGAGWRNSQLANMSVLLGCELANWAALGTHVVASDCDVIVRYVFLLPAGYIPAARQHVAPAMSSAFASLRPS